MYTQFKDAVMLATIKKTTAPAYYYNDELLTVEYSFSEYKPANRWMTSSKLWLDILFTRPQDDQAVMIRVAKSNLILCQPREVIEAVVHREIRNFLQQAHLQEHATAYSQAAPAFC
jgi:hypothetical protein